MSSWQHTGDEPDAFARNAVSFDENRTRADLYALATALLLAPPDGHLLDRLAKARSEASGLAQTPLMQAWEQLTAAALAFDAPAARAEFDALFTGIGTPLLNPHGSLYLSGFMMNTPLVDLRDDLARLGLARRQGLSETEDHLGVLCETMRVLIEGAPARPGVAAFAPQALEVQQAFFERHIGPWYARCLQDIHAAEPANFYRVAADFIQAFLDIEAEAFALFPATQEEAQADSLAC
jgi:TorA maturation chaperone TorD